MHKRLAAYTSKIPRFSLVSTKWSVCNLAICVCLGQEIRQAEQMVVLSNAVLGALQILTSVLVQLWYKFVQHLALTHNLVAP